MTDTGSALAMNGELSLGNTIVCPHCGKEIGAGTVDRLAGAPIGQPPTGSLAMIPYPYYCEVCGSQLLTYVTGDGNMTGGFYCDHCKRDRERGVNADEFAAKRANLVIVDDTDEANAEIAALYPAAVDGAENAQRAAVAIDEHAAAVRAATLEDIAALEAANADDEE